MRKSIVALSLALALIIVSGCSTIPEEQKSSMELGEKVIPPIGYIVFCARNSNECGSSESKILRLTEDSWEKLQTIQWEVNHSVRYRHDEKEKWSYVDQGFGDCEDYALEKRRQLVAVGIPRSALVLSTVTTKTGNYHAVLVVVTDKGDFVLDSHFKSVMHWERNPYTWRTREDTKDPMKWFRVLKHQQQTGSH